MAELNETGAVIGGTIGGAVMLVVDRARGWTARELTVATAVGVTIASIVGSATDALFRWPGRLAELERLMPTPPTVSTAPLMLQSSPSTVRLSQRGRLAGLTGRSIITIAKK